MFMHILVLVMSVHFECYIILNLFSPLGFGQGVRRSVGSIAAILGPLWAASTFSINLYITFGVILGLLLLVLVRPGVHTRTDLISTYIVHPLLCCPNSHWEMCNSSKVLPCTCAGHMNYFILYSSMQLIFRHLRIAVL